MRARKGRPGPERRLERGSRTRGLQRRRTVRAVNQQTLGFTDSRVHGFTGSRVHRFTSSQVQWVLDGRCTSDVGCDCCRRRDWIAGTSRVNHFVMQYFLTMRFPLGIVVVNILGCFIIGLLAGLLASGRIALALPWRSLCSSGCSADSRRFRPSASTRSCSRGHTWWVGRCSTSSRRSSED